MAGNQRGNNMSRPEAKQQIIYPADVKEAADITVDLRERGIDFIIAFAAGTGDITIRILDADVQLSNREVDLT